MKLIIDIDKDAYEEIKKIVANKNEMCFMQKSIANGTPLPKGHGRLIDADYLDVEEIVTDDYSNNKELKVIIKEDLDDAPTIIPADKGDNE